VQSRLYCMEAITVDRVLAEVDRVMQGNDCRKETATQALGSV